jgi:hypothetical protein
MRANNTSHDISIGSGSTFVGTDSRAAEPRPIQLVNSSIRSEASARPKCSGPNHSSGDRAETVPGCPLSCSVCAEQAGILNAAGILLQMVIDRIQPAFAAQTGDEVQLTANHLAASRDPRDFAPRISRSTSAASQFGCPAPRTWPDARTAGGSQDSCRLDSDACQ